MQKKLAAWFLLVALLYALVGIAVPRLQPDPFWQVVLIGSSYVVIGLGVSWLVSHLLTRRLTELARAASVISRGDLTRAVRIKGDDETAQLARSFSMMSESLQNIVLEVSSVAEQINGSAQSLSSTATELNHTTDEIAETTRQIADGAEQQARQVAGTSSTTRELADSIERVSESARSVLRSATEVSSRTSGGVADVRRAEEGIRRLEMSTEAAGMQVAGFRAKANEIASIVNFISSIAHQTHLLAINAAIEAARAGEEGKGFAVVADEVSRLADNASGFADKISSLSDEIIAGSELVAGGIRERMVISKELRAVIQSTTQSLEQIQESSRDTAERAEEISALTESQLGAASRVVASLEQISGIAHLNARGTEEASDVTAQQNESMRRMAGSAHTLAQTSDQLRDLIEIFKLRPRAR